MQILHNLYETSRLTVIVVTHDPTVAKCANRVIKMIDGQINTASAYGSVRAPFS